MFRALIPAILAASIKLRFFTIAFNIASSSFSIRSFLGRALAGFGWSRHVHAASFVSSLDRN